MEINPDRSARPHFGPLLWLPTTLCHLNLRRLWASGVLWLALLLGLSLPAAAQGFGFAPTVMNIDSTQALTTQTVMVNSTQTAAKFTVVAKLWTMANGQTSVVDTRDLIVNPTEFTIKPGASQVIRVGLRKRPGTTELAYRIVVQQLPLEGSMPILTTTAGDGRTANLALAVAFSLPIYVAPPTAKAKIQYTVSRDGTDLTVQVSNSGTRHETYNNMTVKRSGTPVDVQSYAVLSGASYTVRLPNFAAQTGPLLLTFRNADGEIVRETLTVP